MPTELNPPVAPRRRRWVRWLASSLALAAAALLVVLAAAVWRWRAALPTIDGSLTVVGLESAVTIERDAWGIPHITAASLADADAATGFVHGQERLFQMDLLRRFATGRLSEILGGAVLGPDRQARRRGHRQVAERWLAALDTDSIRRLEAYARGVNAAVAVGAALPVEYALLRAGFEPWTPIDSLLAIRTLQERLTESSREMTRFRLAQRVGIVAAHHLLDGRLIGDAVILPQEAAAAGEVEEIALLEMLLREAGDLDLPTQPPAPPASTDAPSRVVRALQELEASHGLGLGSNSWVVSAARTVAGGALLGNDTHLWLETPVPFYLLDLNWEGGRVAGASVPGFPGVVIGRNRHAAWGVTILAADTVDYVIEQLAPDDETAYLADGAPGGRLPFQVEEEIIAVKGGSTVREQVRRTRHGPVIDADFAPGQVLVRADHEPAISGEIGAVSGYAAAGDLDSFRAAAALHGWPPENLVYADAAGVIGYVAAGALPQRGGRSGLLPAAGWKHTELFTGWDDVSTRPFSRQPEEGLLVTANNRVTASERGATWNRAWIPAHRAARATRLLQNGSAQDAGFFRAMQGDTVSLEAEVALTALRLGHATDAWALEPGSDAAAAWTILADWDGRYLQGPAPGLFALFWSELKQRAFADDAGADLAPAADAGLLGLLAPEALASPWPASLRAYSWWDDSRTPALEDAATQIAAALAGAWEKMIERAGPVPAAWHWPDLHRLRFSHPLARLPLLQRLLDGPELPVAGSGGCLLATGFTAHRSFDVVTLPVLRMIADLGPEGGLRMVLALGQSGHPGSAHYADQTPLWAAMQDVEIFSPSATPAARLLLEPR